MEELRQDRLVAKLTRVSVGMSLRAFDVALCVLRVAWCVQPSGHLGVLLDRWSMLECVEFRARSPTPRGAVSRERGSPDLELNAQAKELEEPLRIPGRRPVEEALG
ncbi:hypothetical protein NDU88_007555 [Pleurodeles waltl]|uniref:Uncharacterized protein n=1 Tax=Pleurodeles waltl TaxID=8319 RepID=A0AAV7ST88_PLEWA|nr:hypothetical protein NDU88_007555 [Pleurodeles waltl]